MWNKSKLVLNREQGGLALFKLERLEMIFLVIFSKIVLLSKHRNWLFWVQKYEGSNINLETWPLWISRACAVLLLMCWPCSRLAQFLSTAASTASQTAAHYEMYVHFKCASGHTSIFSHCVQILKARVPYGQWLFCVSVLQMILEKPS